MREARVNTHIKTLCAHSLTCYSRMRMNLLVLWMDMSYVDALEEGFSVCCSARVQVLITLTLKMVYCYIYNVPISYTQLGSQMVCRC